MLYVFSVWRTFSEWRKRNIQFKGTRDKRNIWKFSHALYGKYKGKGHPITGHEGPEGEQIYSSTIPSTSALDGGWVAKSTHRPLYPPPRRTRYALYWGWVCTRVGVGGCRKSRTPPPGIRSRTVQPVASRYTDWATAVPTICMTLKYLVAGSLATSGSALCWWTALQVGRQQVRFPTVS